MVSIIIPYKNPNPFFKECLNSIINQTYKNIQIILVNDHSTDGSEKAAINYQKSDSRIETIKNNGNGIIDALNTGVKVANGKFITRMDSDDIMMDNKIAELRTLLLISGKQHISLGCVKYFASEKKLGQGYINYAKWLNELTINSKNYSEIYKECVIPSPCWMIHREDLIACNGFNPNIYPEDYDLAFRFYKHHFKCIPCDVVLHDWRDYSHRTSRTNEHYAENHFIPLKLDYFLELDFNPKKTLVVWGAGNKGKFIAKSLIEKNMPFEWVCDNPKKIGKDIYGKILRPFNYCIIDEVDSVLIDEAQTPIILADISQDTSIEKFIAASEITNYLELNKHFQIDEKNKNVLLTQEGSKQVETILNIPDLYNPKDPWIPYIINSLKANSLFFNNIHYIIQNNRIIIVDEFTGRIMPDRRWGDGLHQAIEAKEKLPIRPKTETQAAITYQNFFLMYPKLSGMTGTGKTAEIEFEKIYNLPVETVPTFKQTQRNDFPDLIYKDQFSKWNAIAQTCNQISLIGQPILIGTTTVEKSEMLAQLLKDYGLSYQLLNAKPENVRQESKIIAQAGKKGFITIATNMAGRGTDIILGGNIHFALQKELYNLLIFYLIRESFDHNNLFLHEYHFVYFLLMVYV